jgi:alanine-glyoxylate transaminase/serine-glyoxylate transaminase/serine-pyruvate transaminase
MDPRNLPQTPELMIAGPGELHLDDLEVLGHQVIAHYGDVWSELHSGLLDSLSEFLGTKVSPYVIPGTGTTCLDAAVMNLFVPGDKVAVARTGFFGSRLSEIALAQGLEVIDVPVEIGEPVDVQALAGAAEGTAGILTTHVETSTGVRHPIEEIAAMARGNGLTCLVDGIASVGGETLDVEAMGIDALVTSTQKGLESPPGLGVIALSEGGREKIDNLPTRPKSWYLDLKVWDRYREDWPWHPHPVTMPTNLVIAFYSSIRRIASEGLETYIKSRAELASYVREGLQKLGLQMVPRDGFGANLVVAVHSEDPAVIIDHLAERGIMISGGLDPLAGKSFRVGLMGRTANFQMADRVIEEVSSALTG